MAWTVKSEHDIQPYMEIKIPEILSKVLANRGITATVANDLLTNPKAFMNSPLDLVNIRKAVEEIIEAVENNCEIWVFADYDADGMTSGYTMSDFLKTTTNNDVYPYYPNREEGYGISVAFAEMMVARREEIGKDIFVITVDNGTACHEAIDHLKKNGINIVVTDHHQPKETLPECTIVNPQITEDPTFKHLCGAGVAFKVIEAISLIAELPKDYTTKYLHAVAIGTIADMMPLTLENMAYVRLGLDQLNAKDAPYAFRQWKKFLGKKQLVPMDIGWEIGPRLNACGRMGKSDLGGVLFTLDESVEEYEVRDVLLEIEDINQERKALTDRAKKEIEDIDYGDSYVCLFDASAYPAGIAGIIAGKLLEKTGKVSMVYSGKDVLVGSARAPHGFDLQVILGMEKEKDNLLGFGGHHEAAGFSFHIDKMFELQDSLNSTMANIYAELPTEVEEKVLEVDAEIQLVDVNRNNFEALQLFAYDRNTFKAPLFAINGLEVTSFKTSKNNPNNICLNVKQGNKTMMIWAWGYGEYYKQLGEPKNITLLGELDVNFMDKKSITLRVQGLEVA